MRSRNLSSIARTYFHRTSGATLDFNLFQRRSNVIKEITPHVTLVDHVSGKIAHYYGLLYKLIHERTTAAVTDKDVADYQNVVEKVLTALFKMKFPKA